MFRRREQCSNAHRADTQSRHTEQAHRASTQSRHIEQAHRASTQSKHHTEQAHRAGTQSCNQCKCDTFPTRGQGWRKKGKNETLTRRDYCSLLLRWRSRTHTKEPSDSLTSDCEDHLVMSPVVLSITTVLSLCLPICLKYPARPTTSRSLQDPNTWAKAHRAVLCVLNSCKLRRGLGVIRAYIYSTTYHVSISLEQKLCSVRRKIASICN